MNLKSKIFNWLFKNQLEELHSIKSDCKKSLDLCRSNNQTSSVILKEVAGLEMRLRNTVGNIEVATDVHLRSPSWAVICIQGQKTDFIKFIDLGERDIRDVSCFLRKFDKRNIKADLPHGMPKDLFFKI